MTYEEWKPSNEQMLEIADSLDVFGKMVWEEAMKSKNPSSTQQLKESLLALYEEYAKKWLTISSEELSSAMEDMLSEIKQLVS